MHGTPYKGLKECEHTTPSAKPYLKEVLGRLVQLYEATGQPEKVAEWKKLLEPDRAMIV